MYVVLSSVASACCVMHAVPGSCQVGSRSFNACVHEQSGCIVFSSLGIGVMLWLVLIDTSCFT